MPEVPLLQRNKQQDEMSQLQTEHARKRKKLISEQDGDIQKIKQDFVTKKESTLEQGQAAVNHIKKTQTVELDRAQDSRKKLQEKVARI